MHSLEDLYNQYSPMVYRLCKRYTTDPMQAEDLMMEVFMKVHHKQQSFQNKSQIFTWIYRVASNHCLDHVRAIKRRGELVREKYEQAESTEDTQVSPADHLFIERVLEEIAPKTREILFLYYCEGLTHDEISEVVGISRVGISKKIKAFRDDMLHHPFVRELKALA